MPLTLVISTGSRAFALKHVISTGSRAFAAGAEKPAYFRCNADPGKQQVSPLRYGGAVAPVRNDKF